MELDINFQQELIKIIAAFNREKLWYEFPVAIVIASGLVAVLGGAISHLFNVYAEKQRQKAGSDLVKLK